MTWRGVDIGVRERDSSLLAGDSAGGNVVRDFGMPGLEMRDFGRTQTDQEAVEEGLQVCRRGSDTLDRGRSYKISVGS